MIQSGFWIRSSDRDTMPSHVMLSGGKARVPPEHRSDAGSPFLAAVASEVVAGRPMHLVERTFAGGTYRMFADFDVKADRAEGAEAALEAMVRRALSPEGLPEALRTYPIVVCTRKWRDGKIGAHFTWGDALRVDDDRALALRDAWVERLEALGSLGSLGSTRGMPLC